MKTVNLERSWLINYFLSTNDQYVTELREETVSSATGFKNFHLTNERIQQIILEILSKNFLYFKKKTYS